MRESFTFLVPREKVLFPQIAYKDLFFSSKFFDLSNDTFKFTHFPEHSSKFDAE